MKNLIARYISIQSWMQSTLKDEKGATMVEYALMVALIAVACITAVTTLGTDIQTEFTRIGGYLNLAAQ